LSNSPGLIAEHRVRTATAAAGLVDPRSSGDPLDELFTSDLSAFSRGESRSGFGSWGSWREGLLFDADLSRDAIGRRYRHGAKILTQGGDTPPSPEHDLLFRIRTDGQLVPVLNGRIEHRPPKQPT
jgi:hypothetical protein